MFCSGDTVAMKRYLCPPGNARNILWASRFRKIVKKGDNQQMWDGTAKLDPLLRIVKLYNKASAPTKASPTAASFHLLRNLTYGTTSKIRLSMLKTVRRSIPCATQVIDQSFSFNCSMSLKCWWMECQKKASERRMAEEFESAYGGM